MRLTYYVHDEDGDSIVLDDEPKDHIFFGQIIIAGKHWNEANEEDIRNTLELECTGLSKDILRHVISEWKKDHKK